jgi:RimJ/RimL family protein N-acetyltransferase
MTDIRHNSLGQPIGEPLPDWRTPPRPARDVLAGRYCRIEPLDAGRHAGDLFAANSLDRDGRIWTYLAYGPFATQPAYEAWLAERADSSDPLFWAVVDLEGGCAVGIGSYLRIDPANGAIEVGHLAFSPRLQRTRAATEAMYLVMRQAFQLGYRRYEWKCDALNAPSRRAAERLGFVFEGIFRQCMVYKGRNRDTAWYSILDAEWPACKAAFERWLDPGNFDAEGRQRMPLDSLRDETARVRQVT